MDCWRNCPELIELQGLLAGKVGVLVANIGQMVSEMARIWPNHDRFRGVVRQRRLYAMTRSMTFSTLSCTMSFLPVDVVISVSGVLSTNSIKSAFTTILALCSFVSSII
jgi:hypothetical protein